MATPTPLPAATPASGAMAPPSTSPPAATPAKRVVLPRCAAWFSLDSISAVEKRLLPEFFEHEARHKAQFPPGAKLPSSKTPQVYMKYRNYMVHAYRQQPHVYLTATACRRSLAGDACAIMRVHEFLTHWGIINYDVPPHAMPPALHANYALKPTAGDAPLATLVRDGSDKTAGSAAPQDAARADRAFACERCGAGAVAFELSSEAKRKLGAPEAAPSNGYGKRDHLPLQGFGLRPGSGVCDDCYLARSFPDGVDAGDFVRVASPVLWSPQEDALLMDAVSSASSGSSGSQQEACDWNQIAGKVKTKSAEECIVRFLELPLLARATGDPSAATTAPPPTFAYAESANASVVDMAALVRDVDPFVAKAAARAAIQAIKELHKLPPREVALPQEPRAAHTNGGSPQAPVKQEQSEASSAAPSATASTPASIIADATSSNDVEMGNGSTESAGNDKAEIDAAAAAVSAAGEVAGIASIKTEPTSSAPTATATAASTTSVSATPTANGTSEDVEMASADDTAAAPAASPVTKEVLAVVQEASHATAAALMATRADKIATETAQGPMRDLVTQLLQNQLQQMELKMQQLSVLEKALMVEKESLTRERHALYMDRLAFAQQKLHGGNGNTASL